ncbi:MAG: helix-turn-helix transcriptional regulator [Eubacteriales bacterium]|nr:helix-turn-helix transcriptional regulator [Eubacteriales bacterium]
MNHEITFGTFLTNKRKVKDISLRQFAAKMDLSPVYVCNLEKDRRPAPKEEILEKMAAFFMLDKNEREDMYDLAARSKSIPTVSSDLPDYIMDKDIVRVALRTAKDVNATDEEWQEFITKLNNRMKKSMEGDGK